LDLGPGFGLTFIYTLAAALRRFRDSFDLMHCHQGLWEAAATGIIGPFSRKPSVVQPAAGGEFGEIHQWYRTRGRGLLRRMILRNSHFVAISAQIEQELVDFGVPADRLMRLASGVDTDLFSPGESPLETLLHPRPRVLFLGRLHAQKNLSTLLAAWQAATKRVAASLIIAGDGPLLDELKRQSQRSGAAESVHFVGAVHNPLDYLRAADVFVLPSLAEGMSNSLLEAMSVGLPVIASRIGGIFSGTSERSAGPTTTHETSGRMRRSRA
jgi:glycosyltransferase involved in cell wall biosynthesis